MIKVHEAIEMVMAHNKAIEQRTKDTVKKFADGDLTKCIKEAAANGERTVCFLLPAEVNEMALGMYVEDCGFTMSNHGDGRFKLTW